MPLGSPEAARLLQVLWRSPSFLQRLRGDRERRDALRALVALGDPVAIPAILPLAMVDDGLAREAGRAIIDLWRHVRPADLLWLDEAVRRRAEWDWSVHGSWAGLSPRDVATLARFHAGEPVVIGLLASHPSGYVREASVAALGAVDDGREISFLALRANDWVEPVATRAMRLLTARVTVANRDRVIAHFPFLIRALERRRRDQAPLASALQSALRSDGGAALLERLSDFDGPTRRAAFSMLAPADGRTEPPVLRAALSDTDAIVRGRAVGWLARDVDAASLDVLERMAAGDAAPQVRSAALEALAARASTRARALLLEAFLDRSATVRGLARYLAGKMSSELLPRAVYLGALGKGSPRRVAVSLEGLGETGAEPDATLVRPFLTSPAPRVRRAALVALAALAPPVAAAAALDACADPAPTVQRAIREVLTRHGRHANFDEAWARIQISDDADVRLRGVSLMLEAPKWDAVALLLMALDDDDAGVRAHVVELLGEWGQAFNKTYALMPTSAQRERVRALSERLGARVPAGTAAVLRLSLGAER